ncbi:MAG: tolB protein precursor, partial [Cyclobacteriaceae bacterium]|nr:tolB protein precursor [Cyclobacteriaceae bacterium]
METLRYILVVLIIQGIVGVSPGQQFGRNKFSYQNPDFQVKTSPNFEYYYHFDNDSLINHLINRSEWWYAFHQQVFNDTIPFKNPLIFYDNHNDFTVTETISGTIGQGTGGVTESFKNRVIMPLHISPRQTNHVLGHELVHAFQYNMFRGDSALTMNHMRNLPLWMVEGLAEYMSLGAEDITTSMWMRDAVLHDDLPNFRQLSTNPDYFPYRYGHSFWAFITGVYGDSIISKFFRETAFMGFERSCKNVLGIDHKSLALAWHENLKQHYKPLLEGRQAQPVGHPLFNQKKTDINLAPAISPDGHYVAVLSDRNIFTVDLLLIDAHSGEVIKTLFTTRRSNRADEINFIENSGSWSPESMRFAFVVNEKGKNALAIISITGKDIQTINIAEVDEIYYPAWSPDGSLIVFTGMKEGVSNLYLLDPDTRQIKKITHTRYYTKLHPTWSPAGNKVAFSADFDHKHYELAEIDLRDGTIRPLPLFDETDHFNPS